MSENTTALRGIADRVQAATGEDDEVQFILYELVPLFDLSTSEAGTIRLFTSACAYHDAALALMEAVLPGWLWTKKWSERNVVALIRPNQGPVVRGFEGEAATVPLAIILALLTALINAEQP